VAAVKSDSGAIKTKTDFLPSVAAGAAGGVFIAGSNAATSITTALTANITGNLSGSVGSVSGDTKQTADVATLIATVGVAGAGLTALATQASVNTIDDFLDTEIAAILADTNELQTDWANGGRLDLILDAASAPSAAAVADAVWDEVLSGHVGAGSAGAALAAATAPSAATVADAVWDELLADHVIVGSAGAGVAAAGSAGDPWSTALPGAYGAGTAGKMLSDAKTAIDTKAEPGDPMTIARRP
jgi:hypothetical protein